MISLRAALASIISIIYSNQSSLDSTSSYPIWLKNLLSRFTKRDFIQGGLAYLIKDIPYSQAHICRIFKKFIGETITDHLNTIRLNWAKTFLENSSTSISSIAEEIGFTSESGERLSIGRLGRIEGQLVELLHDSFARFVEFRERFVCDFEVFVGVQSRRSAVVSR